MMAREESRYRVWRHTRETIGPIEPVADDIAVEEPMAIRVGGRGIGITMRTPGHDEELALGFLVGEGVIRHASDVVHVRKCDQGEGVSGEVIDVLVGPGVVVDFTRLTRHVFASSSCGVCGSATIEAVRGQFAHFGGTAEPMASGHMLWQMMEQLRTVQPTFDTTGGLHAAALFELGVDGKAKLVVAREDVGRHNAVDKVVGFGLRAGLLPLSRHALLVSGRVSFEIVQKALAAGVRIVAAVSAPTTLAIDLAAESNITLVGFLRPGRFNVYANPQRVRG